MKEKLAELEARYQELEDRLSDPKVLSHPEELKRVAKARAELEGIVSRYRELQSVSRQIDDTQALLAEGPEAELVNLAQAELQDLEARRSRLEQELRLALIPKDPHEDKDVIMEIRAGTGGEEAALFAGDLSRMYSHYAERQGWKMELMSSHPTGIGGFKEVILSVQGEGAYPKLKHEVGVHRVQRVPQTEASGRIHTSTATVAVLPEAEEVEVEINKADLKIQTYRASSAGGQHVQKNDTAVRITHLPTGIVVACEDERSQHQNKEKAMRVLRAHILEKMEEEQRSEIAQARKSQVGTGGRSEKIRTYNFPQSRITDHRLSQSWHNLPGILDGELDPIIQALIRSEQAEKLASITDQ